MHTTNGMGLAGKRVSGYAFHVSITVPDLEEARRFYCDLLGFEEEGWNQASGEWEESLVEVPNVLVTSVWLKVPGGSRLVLQEFNPKGTVAKRPMNRQGLSHVSFGVEDVQAEYERLAAAGVVFRAKPYAMDSGGAMDGYTVAYFEDPWGLTLEILSVTPGYSPVTGQTD